MGWQGCLAHYVGGKEKKGEKKDVITLLFLTYLDHVTKTWDSYYTEWADPVLL